MKLLVKSSRSKQFRKCSKTMPEGPLISKWNMRKNFDLKKPIENSNFELSWKFNKESKHGEYLFSGCKTSNVITISKDVKIRARGARTLVTRVNSLAHPKAKFHHIQHEGGGGIKVESKLGKAIDTSIIKVKVITYAHKRCSTWISSQSLEKNQRVCALIFLCPTNPTWRGKKTPLKEQ